jgi:hypothetical protein
MPVTPAASLVRWTVRPFAFLIAMAAALCLCSSPASGAEMQPRSYAYLLSHATVVAAGTVTGVSSGFLSEGRKAVLQVEGLYKGKVFAQEIEVHWDDKEFEETAYKDDGKVVIFLTLRKDTTYAQVAPGISCWPLERITIKGKAVRAVEYAFPMDLVTDIPASQLRETEEVEKSMNFQMTKRKQWLLADQMLPPIRPVILPKPPKPPKPPKTKPKPVSKSPARPPTAPKASQPVPKSTPGSAPRSPSKGASKTKRSATKPEKPWFIPAE